MLQMIVSFFFGVFAGYILAVLMHSASTYSRDGEFDAQGEKNSKGQREDGLMD